MITRIQNSIAIVSRLRARVPYIEALMELNGTPVSDSKKQYKAIDKVLGNGIGAVIFRLLIHTLHPSKKLMDD